MILCSRARLCACVRARTKLCESGRSERCVSFRSSVFSDSGTSLRIAAYLHESDFDPGNLGRNGTRDDIRMCALVFCRFSAEKLFAAGRDRVNGRVSSRRIAESRYRWITT